MLKTMDNMSKSLFTCTPESITTVLFQSFRKEALGQGRRVFISYREKRAKALYTFVVIHLNVMIDNTKSQMKNV
jgi:hypothetical protein